MPAILQALALLRGLFDLFKLGKEVVEEDKEPKEKEQPNETCDP